MVGLKPTDQMPVTSVMAGAGSGAVGGELQSASTEVYHSNMYFEAVLGNPLFLIKARMQVRFVPRNISMERP